LESLVGKSVKSSRSGVFLKLPIPSLGIELPEPGSENRKLCGRKPTHSGFDLLNSTHCMKPTGSAWTSKQGEVRQRMFDV
jgi:hypothetical protein